MARYSLKFDIKQDYAPCPRLDGQIMFYASTIPIARKKAKKHWKELEQKYGCNKVRFISLDRIIAHYFSEL